MIVFVITENILTDNYTNVEVYQNEAEARERVAGLIDEYQLDPSEVIENGNNWYDANWERFDITLVETEVK